MKILHTADWHIKDSVIDEARECLGAVVDRARKEKPDLITIAADMTDRNNVELDSDTARLLVDTIYNMADVAPVAICTGTPYHDGRIPELVSHLRLGSRVHVTIDAPEQVWLSGTSFIPVDEYDHIGRGGHNPAALITLVPTPSKRFIQQAEASIEETDQGIASAFGIIMAGFGANVIPGFPHIGIGHFSVRGAFVSEYQQMIGREIEIAAEDLDRACADLWCLGHIHKAQQIGKRPIFYSGSIYSKDRGELDPKGFYLHEIWTNDNDPVMYYNHYFIDTPAKRRIVVKIDLARNDFEDMDLDGPNPVAVAQLPSYILCEHTPANYRGAILHVSYRAWQDEADRIDRKAVAEGLIGYGARDAIIEVLRVPRENVRCKDYFDRPTLIAKLNQQADIRGEGEISDTLAEKVAQLETKTREQIMEELPQ